MITTVDHTWKQVDQVIRDPATTEWPCGMSWQAMVLFMDLYQTLQNMIKRKWNPNKKLFK